MVVILSVLRVRRAIPITNERLPGVCLFHSHQSLASMMVFEQNKPYTVLAVIFFEHPVCSGYRDEFYQTIYLPAGSEKNHCQPNLQMPLSEKSGWPSKPEFIIIFCKPVLLWQ